MSGNDIVLLNQAIEQKKQETLGQLTDAEFFELFSFEQVLKNFDLSYDEIFSGKVGGGGDGGIDGFFTFVNGELIDEDTNFAEFGRKPTLEIYILQAKRSPTFSESSIDRVNTTLCDLFYLENDLDDFKSVYDSSLIRKTDLFRKSYLGLASKHPEIKVLYIHTSKGDKSNIHPNVESRAETLRQTILRCLPGAEVSIVFMGARELLDASRVEKSYTLQLKFVENYISKGDNNYIVLVGLYDYFRFVTDDSNNLRRYIFESNVRDYQGDVEVNQDILQTLQSNTRLDFWWLNNGITVLTSKATVAGKTITLDDVQIVNGLQTSVVIYNWLKNKNVEEVDNRRSLLVRIIVTGSSEDTDKIIKATNFQTAIPAASLKATDRVHRNIEEYFLNRDLYYDRRKNHYKNAGKPASKIISIPYLSQSIMAIVLQEPDNARARPTSLIKRPADYKRVFDESIALDVYYFCATVMKKIDWFIRNRAADYAQRDKTDMRFHISMVLMTRLLAKNIYAYKDIETLRLTTIEDSKLEEAIKIVMSVAQIYASDNSLTIERIAKSREFVVFLQSVDSALE